MGRPSRLLLAVATAAALALSACGADTAEENAYVDAVNRTRADFEQAFARLGDDITATSTPKEDQRTLARYQAAAQQAVGRLRALDPPESVADLHRRLVGDVGRYEGLLAQVRRAVASVDQQRILRARSELDSEFPEISADVNSTIADINEELRG